MAKRSQESSMAVLAESELVDHKPTRAMYDGVPILLVRRGERVFALAETCSHFSGPLAEDKLVGDSIDAHITPPDSPWMMDTFLTDQRYTLSPAWRFAHGEGR